jgi:hypothetical protein
VVRKPLKRKKAKKQGTKIAPSIAKVQAAIEKGAAKPNLATTSDVAPVVPSGLSLLGNYGSDSDSD